MTLREQQALKIKLEKEFRRQVRTLLKKIVRQYRLGISTGRFVKASKFKEEIRILLENHYEKVQNAFLGVISTDTKKDEEDMSEELALALSVWALEISEEVSTKISNTTQNDMDDAITQTRQAFSIENNFNVTNRELATVSAVLLGRKFKAREETIVITETQKPAESTKLLEAYGLAGIDPMVAVTAATAIAVIAMKEWHDVGDGKVRRGHHAGEVAPVRITEPFRVRGQFLMYPGDGSMGASASNIVNCRCGTLYTIT